MTLEPHVHLILRNEYNVKDLPYVLPLVILEAGNTLSGSKKVKSFTGLASRDFAIKATPAPQGFHQIADLTKL